MQLLLPVLAAVSDTFLKVDLALLDSDMYIANKLLYDAINQTKLQF